MGIFSAGSASVQIVPDFSGAQKAIGAWFAQQKDLTVGVKPDVNAAELAKVKAEISSIDGTAHVTVDKSSLEQDVQSGINEGIKKGLGAVAGNVGLSALSDLVNSTLKPTLITAIGGAFTELAAAASQAVGILALAPAGMLALAAPAAVVALGVQGMGAAFKALGTGNLQQIQAAMAKLSPAAQQLVLDVHALGPAFDSLKLDVQQQLWNGVGTAVTGLAHTALPILQTGLAGVAADMNSGILATIHTLQADAGQFPTIFGNITTAGRAMAGTMAPLTDAFVRMAQVGSSFLPQIADGFLRASLAADQWVVHAQATGQLTNIIQAAINVIDQLGRLLLNVGSILSGVFQAAMPYGNALLGLLVGLTGQLAVFVHSTEGQSALASFFSSVNTAIVALIGPLSQAIQAIVLALLPAIGLLAADLAPVVGQLLTQFASVMLQIGAILPPVASTVAALVSAFAPLIPTIGSLITTILPPLLQILNNLAPVIGQFTQALGTALLGAVQAVTPFLLPLGNGLIAIFQALLPLIPLVGQLAGAVGQALAITLVAIVQAIQPLIPPLVQLVQTLVPPLVNLFRQLAPLLVELVQDFAPFLLTVLKLVDSTVLPFLVGLINNFTTGLQVIIPLIKPMAPLIEAIAIAVGVWTAAQALLDIALDANPIGLIVIAIAALIIAIGFIVTHTQELGAIWTQVWGAITTAFTVAWQAISSLAVSAWTAVQAFFVNAWASFTSAWTNLWNGIVSFFQGIWNTLVSWVEGVWSGLAGFFANAWAVFTGAWSAFWNGVFSFFQGLWNSLVSWVEGVWSGLVGWFASAWAAYSSAWVNLWNAVLSFFQGLWNTLVSWAQAIWSALAGFFANAWAVFTGAWSAFWNGVFSFFQNLWNTLVSWVEGLWSSFAGWFANALAAYAGAWQAVWNGIVSFFQGIWNGIVSFAQGAWNTLSGWLTSAINTFAGIFEGVWTAIQNVVGTIWNSIVSAIQSAWNTITGIVEAPIRFIVNTVIDGFIGGVDSVLSFLQLPWSIPKITLPFADGGFTGDGVFGTGGKYDPAGVVHAREFVVNQEQTAKFLPLLTAINSGGFADGGYVGHLGEWPGYAAGGLVGDLVGLVTNPVGTLVDFLKTLLPANPGGLQDLLSSGALQMVQNVASTLGTDIKNAIFSLFFNPDPNAVNPLASLSPSALSGLAAVIGAPGGLGAAAAGISGLLNVNIPTSQAANVAAVQQAAAAYGWNVGIEWTDLVAVINRESGFNNTAQNPVSTAYGMFQFLDSTWAGFPYPKTSNALEQAIDGMLYIKERYGDPAGALAHEQAFGWYDTGGILPPGWSTIYNGTGSNEVVLNPPQQDSLNTLLTPTSSSGKGDPQSQPVWQFFLGDREITDLVDARVTYWSATDARNIRSSV